MSDIRATSDYNFLNSEKDKKKIIMKRDYYFCLHIGGVVDPRDE